MEVEMLSLKSGDSLPLNVKLKNHKRDTSLC